MASDFGNMASRVEKLSRDLEREHENATEDAMDTMQTQVRNEIGKNDSVARSNLIRDVRESRDVASEFLVERSTHVPEWAKYLEHGTGSRAQRDTLPDHESYPAPSPMPPLERIVTWIVAKNITPREYDSTYGLAKAIQETIGAVGTFPHPFLRPVWHGTYGWLNVVRENKRGMKRALRRL
jgi:hypothetical protein